MGSLFRIGSSNDKAYALDSPSATTSLSIANRSLSTTVAPGKIGYVSSSVTYSASDIANYTLRVTYANGYNALRLNGNGSTTLAGANTKTPTNMADNTWGYAWGNTSDTNSNMTYYTVPAYGTTGTGLANGYLAGGSTASIASTTKKIVFAAKFGEGNNSISNGHYSTSVLLSLIATPKQIYNYSLQYDANGGSGAPEAQTALAQTGTTHQFVLPTNNLTKKDYKFVGWAEDKTATTADHQPGATITLTSASPSQTLYAVWSPVTGFTLNGTHVTSMQSSNLASYCRDNMAVGDTIELQDTRDNNVYTIKKLATGDIYGKRICWMMQNLRIVDYTTTANDSQTGGFTIPASSTSGFSALDTANAYYSGNNTYGTYYSWFTATAGTGKQSTSSGEAIGSICPKGWGLPTRAEYTTLKDAGTAKAGIWSSNSTTSGYWVGGTANTNTAAFWHAAGYYNDGSPYNVGTDGYYWSSTAFGSNDAYRLYFHSSYTPDLGFNYKSYGFSVRCVVDGFSGTSTS